MNMRDYALHIGKSETYFYVMKITQKDLYKEILRYDNPALGYRILLTELDNLKAFIVNKYYDNRDDLYESMLRSGVKKQQLTAMVDRCCRQTEQLVYKTLVMLRKIKEYYVRHYM